MKRREFIGLLAGAATAWPLGARAQQNDHVRRIGFLMPSAETDTNAQSRVAAFREDSSNWAGLRVAIFALTIAGLTIPAA